MTTTMRALALALAALCLPLVPGRAAADDNLCILAQAFEIPAFAVEAVSAHSVAAQVGNSTAIYKPVPLLVTAGTTGVVFEDGVADSRVSVCWEVAYQTFQGSTYFYRRVLELHVPLTSLRGLRVLDPR